MGWYRVHEFAQLAGVTVKALHHYDRLGLLTPRRSESGYRVYSERDLERLEQIVALKFLGLPLRQIKVVLEQTELALPEVLRVQRKAIEEKQALLARAAGAIQAAEDLIAAGRPADPATLRKIIEVIDVQNDVEQMKKYYSDEAWERRRQYYENGPAPEWVQLYSDTSALLGTDPGSDAAQALSDRWLKLSVRAWTGDLNVQTDSPAAWMDRANWPAAMKQRVAEYNREQVAEFIKQVAMSARKKYFSEAGWARFVKLRERLLADTMARSSFWQERLDLFCDLEASLGEDPAGAKGQALAARWQGQLAKESDGDPEVKAGLMNAWADRRNWTATVRWYMEGLAMMNSERFERAADFLDAACRAAVPQ
jgi:MerR family transcriptional regulator, thiopeptide resistance regulator